MIDPEQIKNLQAANGVDFIDSLLGYLDDKYIFVNDPDKRDAARSHLEAVREMFDEEWDKEWASRKLGY